MSISRIDSDLCNGCGLCVDTCSQEVFKSITYTAAWGQSGSVDTLVREVTPERKGRHRG